MQPATHITQMELTIDQALQQGVTAHKEGKLQDAERLYRAILQAQPKHPDANHNLGVLAVSVGKSLDAVPLFKLALEANPKVEQFWLSYVDALIKVERFDEAKRVLVEGEKSGIAKEKLGALNQRLQDGARNGTTKVAKGRTLSEKREKLAEKKKRKNRKARTASSSAAPSQDQISLLLDYYQAGRLEEVEALAKSLTQQFPKHPFGWKVLGVALKKTGRIAESLAPLQAALELSLQDAEAHSNLGNTLAELGRLEEAEVSHRQAIALKPDFAEARCNLGNTLKGLGRLDEAEASYRKATTLKPDYATAHSNLGNALKELGRLDEAEASYRQAIALNPDYSKAHYNLGNTLRELGRLDEAEASYKQAIAVTPDYAYAHYNLGITLEELGRLDEAEASCRQAIALKPDLVDAHGQLGQIFFAKGQESLALVSVKKALSMDSSSRMSGLLLNVIQSRTTHKKAKPHIESSINRVDLNGLMNEPLILNRLVEAELVDTIYAKDGKKLDSTRDARFGNGTCSPDFNFFEDTNPVIQKVAADLTRVMTDFVKSDIFILDSFFNILGAGGGTTPHDHLKHFDLTLRLAGRKYSLVYYVSVGDQNCADPGILKLYDPSQDILPSEGMIVIIPSTRRHSAIYGGRLNRVMIGVNFYAL